MEISLRLELKNHLSGLKKAAGCGRITKKDSEMRKLTLLILLATFFHFLTGNKPTHVEQSVNVLEASLVSLAKTTGDKRNTSLTRVNFEEHILNLYGEIRLQELTLDFEVFRMAMVGYYALKKEGALSGKDLISIIDFARPSTEKRFYTIDLRNREVKYHTYVAHGRNTGQNMATEFSNIPHSNQSSLGFYVTGETYVGSKGYSLRLDGMETSFNDKIRSRAVVMHAADYATESWIKRYGRLGRSQGCPALPPHLSREVIDTIKGKTAIFTYYPDETYLSGSRYLQVEELFEKLDEKPIELAIAQPMSQS